MLLVCDWDPDGEGIFDDNCNVTERCSQSRQREATEHLPEPAAVNADENDDEDDVLLVGDYDPQLEEEEFLGLSPAGDEREDTTVGTHEVRTPVKIQVRRHEWCRKELRYSALQRSADGLGLGLTHGLGLQLNWGGAD